MTAQALAERDDKAPATVETLPTSDLAFIERMALNPAIDPEKLERLIAMQKDMQASRAKIAFTQAMVAMRPELPRIEKKGKTDKADYGKWEDIQDGVDPVLSRHGFDLTFKTSNGADSVTVTAVLRHREGHEDTTDLTLPHDKGPGRNSVQAVGSTVSYGKRYTAVALLNLRIGGEDDDGAKGGGAATISDEQFETLSALMDKHGADLGKFCTYFKIAALPDLPVSKFAQAETMIKAKRK
jgi:hypothetical protein